MTNDNITRRIDDLGRVVIPKTIRQQLGWQTDDQIVLEVDKSKGSLVLTKYVYNDEESEELL